MNNSDQTKLEAAKWLSDLGLAVTGTKQDLLNRISKYKLYPKLVEKLWSRTKRNRTFPTSLDSLTIPNVNANWRNDNLPKVDADIYQHYISMKKEGSMGQQEKAHRIVQSRKITTVKTFLHGKTCYVKAAIMKSYGHESRPATVLFEDGLPKKGYCPCPVGVSGLCCHVIALLLFLKHFTLTGEKILALTCTQKLQKWHRRSKGSIPLNQNSLKKSKFLESNKTKICKNEET